MKQKSAKQILKQARGYIAKGWCQDYPAKDKEGFYVDVMDNEACRWCAGGAINKASRKNKAGRKHSQRSEQVALDTLEEVIGDTIPAWNDAPHRTKRQVLAAFDKAIKLI